MIVIVSLSLLLSIVILHRSFQRQSAEVVFYSFLVLGIGCTAYLPLAVYIPAYWLVMANYLRSMSLKKFSASLLGMAVPFCYLGVYLLYKYNGTVGDWGLSTLNIKADIEVPHVMLWVILVTLIAAMGRVYMFRVWQQKKVSTRLKYNSVIALIVFTLILAIIFPPHGAVLLGLLIALTLYSLWMLSPLY